MPDDWPLVVARLLAANLTAALDDADLVFAAWPDPDRPRAIGYLLLKGEVSMLEDNPPDELTMSAVMVSNEDEALALQKAARERGNGGV